MQQKSGAPQFSAPTLEIRDRAIAPEIVEQARKWPVYLELDPAPHAPLLAGAYLRCRKCNQGVRQLGQGLPNEYLRPYTVTVEELEAHVLAHVLQVHRGDVDPGWSGS